MNIEEITRLTTIAQEAAEAGCKVLQQYWGKLQNYDRKSSRSDLVTIADYASEKAIINVLNTHCPKHGILAEESGFNSHDDNDFVWVIDPLDGTTNYTHQFPFIAVSIALMHKNIPIVGVVHNPIMNECFWAGKGLGAHLNGDKIQVSTVDTLANSLLATGFPYDRHSNPDNNYKEFAHFTQQSQGVRRAGSAALDMAYVACGRLDGYWEQGLHLWDVAAGYVLVKEAGGTVTTYKGEAVDLKSGKLLASNKRLHTQMVQELSTTTSLSCVKER